MTDQPAHSDDRATDPDEPRVREIQSPGLQVTNGLFHTVAGLTMGSITTFLGVLVLAIVIEETGVLDLLGVDLDFDALFRASMGPVLISWGVMAIAWPAVLIAGRFATFAAVEELARQHPTSVPPRAVREGLKTPPAKMLRDAGVLVCWIAGGLLALCVCLSIYMAGENFDSFVISLIITAVVAGLFGIGYVMTVFGRRYEPAQVERLDALRAAWKRQAPRADHADRAIRKTLPVAELPHMVRTGARGGFWVTALGWLLGLGAAIFMLGVMLRQPCRHCEQRTYGAAGESVIDSAATLGGGLLTVFGLLCLAAWLFSVGRRMLAEESLRRWLAAGGRRRVEDQGRVVDLLGAESTGSLANITLASFGTAVLIIAGGIAMVEWEGVDASIALAVGQGMLFIAVLVGALSYRREVGMRVLMRERLLPGDLPSPAELAKQRQNEAERKQRKSQRRDERRR
ncbi:hypothetical protein [Microbacterium sp. H1-D42]|uniref:hypothetical protein n=1 Tax=Microbacterium sp. H1-D42 TaxID=2925844 RepID=UPI001F534879|nr:hypothetical protein [Microbacterium sp. H1-D42]UNK70158.1 hypothetical protein MNR00_13440 [Microbacterium sp. H1-D42]